MIRMYPHSNADTVKEYFRNGLAQADYYIDGDEMPGEFLGKLGKHLSVSGAVSNMAFYDLCDNVNPITGTRLTQRNDKNRTIGYDINFHCPKSLSILYGLSSDEKILKGFQRAVRQAMLDMEQDMKTRIRKDGVYDDRKVQNLLWAEFIHKTSRPVVETITKENGEKVQVHHPPDPHLHAHCFVFNAVYDAQEDKIKAGQFRDINRDMPYYQARFHTYLANEMMDLGYQVHKTKSAFELDMVPQKAIELMSKRTNEIGRVARDEGITNPKALGELGARTRAVKKEGMTQSELRQRWKEQFHDAGLKNGTVDRGGMPLAKTVTKEQSLDYAIETSFERRSTVNDRRILANALHFGVDNRDLTVEAITEAFDKDNRILAVDNFRGQTMCTVKHVFMEEKQMVDLAREGRNAVKPLAPERIAYIGSKSDVQLDTYQTNALRHILSIPDRVILVGGGAGAGKTAMTIEARDLLHDAGHEVKFFAPTVEASRATMREIGLDEAETVQKLLINEGLQKSVEGKVLWIDEAGMLGTKDMARLLELVQEKNARCVLSGDTRQHSSPQRGNGLRILRDQAKLPNVTLQGIYRQRNEDARKVVKLLQDGKMKAGFELLDKVGNIVEKPWQDAANALAKDYVEALGTNKNARIIAPTNEQCDEVTRIVRDRLRDDGRLTGKDKQVRRLRDRQLDEVQKQDHRNYRVGDVIQTHQNLKGIKRGTKLIVTGFEGINILIQDESLLKKPVFLSTDRSHHFDVYREVNLPLAKGDIIKRTKNGQDVNGQRLNNGQMLVVTGFTREGNIRAKTWSAKGDFGIKEYMIDKRDGNINHAVAITSASAQSKTVDVVFVFQPVATFPATNEQQFYTSVTRAREIAKVYTDNRTELKQAVQKQDVEVSALELAQIAKLRKQGRSIEANRLNTEAKPQTPDKSSDTPDLGRDFS